MKLSIAHHWLVNRGGAENCLDLFVKYLKPSTIYTLFWNSEKFNYPNTEIIASKLNRLPYSASQYPKLLYLYPRALKKMEVSTDTDILLSSDASIIKGISVGENTKHICYCYSPPRYLWKMPEAYLENAIVSTTFKKTSQFIKKFDFEAAQRVDEFIGISKEVVQRIEKYYQREATLIYPPVDVNRFTVKDKKKEHYISYGRLVPYKKFDLAVQTFNKLKKTLYIVGEGPEKKKLKKMANPKYVKIMGRLEYTQLIELLESAKALIFPGEEDFGIIPVEAMACGTPVLAYNQGGATETVIDQKTGILFEEQSIDSLAAAVKKLDDIYPQLNFNEIRTQAEEFSEEKFINRIMNFISSYAKKKNSYGISA